MDGESLALALVRYVEDRRAPFDRLQYMTMLERLTANVTSVPDDLPADLGYRYALQVALGIFKLSDRDKCAIEELQNRRVQRGPHRTLFGEEIDRKYIRTRLMWLLLHELNGFTKKNRFFKYSSDSRFMFVKKISEEMSISVDFDFGSHGRYIRPIVILLYNEDIVGIPIYIERLFGFGIINVDRQGDEDINIDYIWPFVKATVEFIVENSEGAIFN